MTTQRIERAPCDTFCDICDALVCVGEQTVMVEEDVIPERYCINCAMKICPSFVADAE